MERIAANLLCKLNPERFSGALVCLDSKNGALDIVGSANRKSYVFEKRPGIDLHLIWQLWRHFRLTRPDLVFSFNDGALLYAFPAAKLAGVQNVLHAEHGRLPGKETWLLRFARSVMMRLSQRVVAVSDEIGELLRNEKVPTERIFTISNGISLCEFESSNDSTMLRKRFGIHSPVLMVGTVGSLTAAKNHEFLIRGAEKLPNACFFIAGDGPLKGKLQELIKHLNLVDRVFLVGRITDVSSFLGALDVFVLPSLTEGTSLALLEAMAAGLPVVATDVGGNRAVVEDGVTGVLIPSGDIPALVNAVGQLDENIEKRREMGNLGRARVEERFDFSITVRAYETLFEQVRNNSF